MTQAASLFPPTEGKAGFTFTLQSSRRVDLGDDSVIAKTTMNGSRYYCVLLLAGNHSHSKTPISKFFLRFCRWLARAVLHSLIISNSLQWKIPLVALLWVILSA